jgi:hypothetical protein
LAVIAVGGCVERTITITSSPPGSLVFLNDQEIGRTPVTRDFIWYGNYQVTLRKEGYQTLKTTQSVRPPIYQIVPIDLVAELLPFHYHDQQAFSFNLLPMQPTERQELLDRAEDLKSQLLPSERAATQPSQKSEPSANKPSSR